MIGKSTVVSPFGSSIPNLTQNVDFGYKRTNISGGTLARGSVVMPAYLEGGHGIVRTKLDGPTGLFSAVKLPNNFVDDGSGTLTGVANNKLYARGPFYVTTNDAAKVAADDGDVFVWDGGPSSSYMQVLVRRDWTTALSEGILLGATTGQAYLSVANAAAATISDPVARVAVRIPAGTYAASVSTQLITVQFIGTGPI